MKRHFVMLTAFMCGACTVNMPLGKGADYLDLNPEVLDAFLAKEVLLVGETHKKARSYLLVQSVLERALSTHGCVVFAVEISSDQQKTLDAVRAGTATIDQIEIWDALDFPPYRNFLADMLQRSASSACFSVHAIDLPAPVEGNRDSWMADHIVEIKGKNTLVIALLGTLHVVRGIRYTSLPEARNVADRLEAANLSLTVLVQDWPSECSPGFALPGTQAFTAFVGGINRIINGTVQRTEAPPADAILSLCS